VRWNPLDVRVTAPCSPRILGVDPGSLATGWGLVTGPATRPRLIACDAIRAGTPSQDLSERLSRLRAGFEDLLTRLAPDCAAVESPYHGVNARAALQLAHARGVILAALAAHAIPVVEYAPATVKKAVTGNGRATKDQVRSMVARILRAPDLPASADASDALAVAVCHGSLARHRTLVESTQRRGPVRRSSR